MKKILSVAVTLIAISLISFPVIAEEASVELGQKLFTNPGLGASKNAKSCNTCHENGSGLENARNNPKLTKIINTCIAGPMKGEKLNEQTVAMKSLIMYIKSLGK